MREGSVRVPIRAATPPTGGRGLSAVTGIVLAGGRSTRFGADKLAADLRGTPLLHHAVTRVADACGEVVVVLAPGAHVPALPPGLLVRFARDVDEARGPLAGLAAGLSAVETPLALVAAGDMPEMSAAVLRELLRVIGELPVDAVVLADGTRHRPLPCVVRVPAARANADEIVRSRPAHERSVRTLLDSLGVAVIDEATWRGLDPTGGTLRDVDTPEDLDLP